jgi:CheY-like chemotaxis protein
MNRPDTIVLVVDDEPLVLFMVESALGLRGFRVLTAATGAAALELCARHGADIGAALVDVTLRVEDGRQVLADLRAALPGLPVALMTGDPSQLDYDELHELGVVQVLAKPFRNLDEVCAAVKNLLASPCPRGDAH